MLEYSMTYKEIANGSPSPTRYVKEVLKRKGFEVSGVIHVYDDPANGRVIYRQGDTPPRSRQDLPCRPALSAPTETAEAA